ncbi:MAG: hypothetical protein R2755_32835 [Acidimicrobiales bacterium]
MNPRWRAGGDGSPPRSRFSLVAGAVSLLSPLTSRLPHLPAPVHLRARRSD